MRPLCVIPARRGSKRLPLKNVLPLAGKPMLAYSIEVALESRLFDKVFVSTEDPEIATIAHNHGAVVHHRPFELADDLAGSDEVCIEVYRSRAAHGDAYDAIVCLQPSSPLRKVDDLQGAWKRFCESNANFLVSATLIDPHYFHWAIHDKGDWWELCFGERYMIERPLLPPVYRPNGSIKIARSEWLVKVRHFFGPKLMVYETPEERSIHVATPFDYEMAEFLLSRRGSH